MAPTGGCSVQTPPTAQGVAGGEDPAVSNLQRLAGGCCAGYCLGALLAILVLALIVVVL
jgi:hypothetical protein